MKCHHGVEVGDPPQVDRCERGFPYCPCGDDATDWLMDPRNNEGISAPLPESVLWWQGYGQL